MQLPASPLAPFVGGSQRRAGFSVRPRTSSGDDEVSGILGGAAEVDITPPPGMPKAGYSSNAHDGNGFRGRLRARVIHLASGSTSLAIVQCDLLGGSSVVQHLVAHRVAEQTGIPVSGIMIGATHTHAGPGQFLGTDFYNAFASNRGGFDPAWTEFLVSQISSAVLTAHEQRVPVRVAVGEREVWGFTRNRSLPPHVNNNTVSDKRVEPQRKWVAVNPLMAMIRVDTVADALPLAAMAVFSVHGTGVSQHSHEYNADLWAYLVGELNRGIEDHSGARAITGAIEGTHADVAPALRPDSAGHIEARRVGEGIGAEATELWASLEEDLSTELTLGIGLREIRLDDSTKIDGIELPNRPAVGAALVAGAIENLTPVIGQIPPFRAGFPKRRQSGPHGPKWILGSERLQPLLLPLKGFPRTLPCQVIRIGSHAIVGLPFEVTTEAGREIAAAASEAATSLGVDNVVISSVANEYCGYSATAKEYELQYYEGGHTLYGPNTTAFLGAHVSAVMELMASSGDVCEVERERSWNLRSKRFLAKPTGEFKGQSVLAKPTFADPTIRHDAHWEFSWTDNAPGDIVWHERVVAVEQRDPGTRDGDGTTPPDPQPWEPVMWRGRAVTDDENMQLIYDGTNRGGQHRYRVRWFNPDHRAGREYRFVITTQQSASFESPAFS